MLSETILTILGWMISVTHIVFLANMNENISQKIITVGCKKYILVNLAAKISVTHIAFLAKICSWPYRINVLSAKNHIVETW